MGGDYQANEAGNDYDCGDGNHARLLTVHPISSSVEPVPVVPRPVRK